MNGLIDTWVGWYDPKARATNRQEIVLARVVACELDSWSKGAGVLAAGSAFVFLLAMPDGGFKKVYAQDCKRVKTPTQAEWDGYKEMYRKDHPNG